MKKNRSIKKIIVTLLIINLLLVGAIGFYAYTALQPVGTSEEIVFEVKSGDTVASVSKRLKEEGLIKNVFISEIYIKLSKLNNLKVGSYTLNTDNSVKDIFLTLNNAGAAISDDVKVVLPEGLWAKEMASRIAAATKVKEEDLLELWNDETYLKEMIEKYPFLTNDILNDQLNVKLEGYLFPETYYFSANSNKYDVTERLLDQTLKIYEKHKADFDNSEFTIHEIFTLASMTQFESGTSKDNKIISGVWMNRLAIDMKLESSVTICYALYDYEHWRDCEVNPNIDSPYNTYLYKGIPIGPIDNPGEDAIVSVLHPEKTKYLFFIGDVYGDGTVYYAETYAEHEANIDKYLRP